MSAKNVLKKFKFKDANGGFNLMELRNRNILFNDKKYSTELGNF